MKHCQNLRLLTCALGLCAALSARAQIGISGITDKTVYYDQATFTVTHDSGYSYDARLDGIGVPVGTPVLVKSVNYHELSVLRTNTSTAAVTSLLVRFIVSATERGGSEDGLPPWTPHPVVPSATAEFAGAHLRMLLPRAFPAGDPIPVVAWVENEQGHAVRVNGMLSSSGQPGLNIRRGVGSGFLEVTNPAGTFVYTAQVASLQATNLVLLESNTIWTSVSGMLPPNTVWPPNSRIVVTGTTTNPAGSTLSIGAGTIVRVNAAKDIYNFGHLVINGLGDNLVVFMPAAAGQPWGGFIQHANNASFTATGAVFTGSGAYQGCWFTGHGCSSSVSGISSHRGEQALISLQGTSCNLMLTDCAAIYLDGQFAHAAGGVNGSYAITLTRFLMQHCTTGGEYTDASFTVNDCAFIECPDDSADFVDGDNDALYLVNGNHSFTNSLWGWTKDDGVDSGGSGAGVLNFHNCWFESIFHEANSLSGTSKIVSHYDSVFIDCSQGLESGYDGPTGNMFHCLATGNLVGGRFGDNYNWTYTGLLRATNSLLLYNYRNVWGMNWQDWTYRASAMDIHSNFFSAADPQWPGNKVWDPSSDAAQLADFFNGPADSPVGIGIALRTNRLEAAALTNGIAIRLSRFSTNTVAVNFTAQTPDTVLASGDIVFQPGETLKTLSLPILNPQGHELIVVSLSKPSNGEITGLNPVFAINTASSTNTSLTLIPLGATWRYLDNGVDQGTGWMDTNWSDTGWSSGAARFGFNTASGNSSFTTALSYGTNASNKHTTYYFRRQFVVDSPGALASLYLEVQRDDGVATYLNGENFYRNNLPSGALAYSMFATNATDNGATFQSATLPLTGLVAGTNLLAAEIHQSSLDSSDLVFDLHLAANLQPSPPTLKRALLPEGLVLFWDDPAFALEEASSLGGPWTPVAGVNPQFIRLSGNQRFFRLLR